MSQKNARGRSFDSLVVAFVLFATVVAVLGVPVATSAFAAASRVAIGGASNGWTLVFQAPDYASGRGFHFYNLTFVNRDVGFAYGGDEWRGDELGRIYRTTNGGATWQEVYRGGGWKIGMACADTLRCWVGGKGGRVDYTEDGGNSWHKANAYSWYGLTADPPAPQPTAVPFGAWIRSSGITTDGKSVIFGATDNVILQSSDGRSFYNYWPPLPWYAATWGVTCTSPTLCYGGQIKRRVVISRDGGKSWESAAYVGGTSNAENCLVDKFPVPDGGIQRRYYGLSFVNDNYGWIVGSCGAIYRTINGGQGWQAQNANVPEENILRQVKAVSKTSAIAVGGVNPAPQDPSMALNAVIYGTKNGDQANALWSQIAAPETSELHGLAVFSDATYVVDWSGKIWRWDGELVPVPANTSTPTPTSTPTITATSTEPPTATPTTFPSTGSLEVIAFFDINWNGQPDQGETPLGGAEFRLSNSLTPVATGVTEANGRVVFTNLDPGLYTVDETMAPVGYTPNVTNAEAFVQPGTQPIVPFPHRMSTQTPEPTATPTRSADVRQTWLPLLLR